ncbi:DUF4245 family protein [Microbacterium halophytorum]|uniref:DUF4245 family protein n=1 Tax=Microbacterium halophytorum TaxID=2067568 RepID=UPI001319E992|nr:DUF4245 family protein [Microbacterium halophytorum]
MARSPLSEQSAEDIAAQKAARSAAYRSSQTVRNLLIALGVTLLIVVVVVWGVPRGTPAEQPDIDVAQIAADTADAYDVEPLVPDLSDDWRVNFAEVTPEQVVTWRVTYLTPDESDYVTMLEGFGGDEAWASQKLDGAAPEGTTTIDGVEWTEYEIGSGQRDAGYEYAIGAATADGFVLLYGSASAETTADVAAAMSDQITQGSDGAHDAEENAE